MAAHDQTWVKVNAKVDSELGELISVLNTVPGLQTLSSCQGEAGPNGYPAFVYFYFGTWEKLCGFVFGKLEPVLKEFSVELSVEAVNGSDPMGKITFSARATKDVTAALKRVIS